MGVQKSIMRKALTSKIARSILAFIFIFFTGWSSAMVIAQIVSESIYDHLTRANITDRDGAIALVTLNLEQFKLVRTMMVDSGYTGQNFANEISSLTSAKVIVVK